MTSSIEQAWNITDLPKEFDDIKNQTYFQSTYKKLQTWYGTSFNDNEIKIIKWVRTNSYNEYKKDITNTRAIIIANRIDKWIFEYKHPHFIDIDKTIIRQIPNANRQRKFRDIAITIEEKFHELSVNEISIIKKEFQNAKNKWTLPNADKIATEIADNRLASEIRSTISDFSWSLKKLQDTAKNNISKSKGTWEDTHSNEVDNQILDTQDSRRKHAKKYQKWPSKILLKWMDNIKLSPHFQDIENKLFEGNQYNWDEYWNWEYVKYFFRESAQFLESCSINEIDDNTFLIIQNELQLISLWIEHDSERLKQNVLKNIFAEDRWFTKLWKVLHNINYDLESLNDDIDEEMLKQMEDAELAEEISYLEKNWISGKLYKKARIAQKKYSNKLKNWEELSENEMLLLKKLNIILWEDWKCIGEIIKLHKIKEIQKNNETKKFDWIKTPQIEQTTGNIKSINPDNIVQNNQNIHDYVFQKDNDIPSNFDWKIDEEYRKILYDKLIEIHKNDIAFVESIKYLDEYGHINHKKAKAENIDEESLQENFKTINKMINKLARKEFHDKEKIKKINEICTRKSIMTTCFRALSNYFDSTNNNWENFADSFEIWDINKDIDFNEETGIIKMKWKIWWNNIIWLYYDTKKWELSFDNFIWYNSNIWYVIWTNNWEKEKLNIKLPTMEEMEKQSNKVDKDLVYKLSINTTFYIKALSKCINESLRLWCFQWFIGTEMDVNKQFVKEFNEKNILKQEIFRSIYTKYYGQDSIYKIINDKLEISEWNDKQQFKLIKLISDSIDNCKNSNELLRFRNLITEFDKLISPNLNYVKNDRLLKTLFANNLNDDNDIYDQSASIMENENPNIAVDKNRSWIYWDIDHHSQNSSLNYYTFLDLLAEDQGINRIINLDAFGDVIKTIQTDWAQLLDKKDGILWTNYLLKVVEWDLSEIVPISN